MYRGTTANRAGVTVQIVWKNGVIGLVRGSIRRHSGERSCVLDRQGGEVMEKSDRSPLAGCGSMSQSPAASPAHSIAKSRRLNGAPNVRMVGSDFVHPHRQ